MPLPEPTRTDAAEYARNDLPGNLEWHVTYFDFISDEQLRHRLGQELYAARYLYKLWEGLRLEESWAIQAQIQLQIQQYASIYEACIHHLLFVEAADEERVRLLGSYSTLVERTLPKHLVDKIRSLPSPDAGSIVGAVRETRATSPSKIRFDSKVACAVALGIIDDALGCEIKGFYTARNYIHIHAELRQKDLQWQISFARDAYRRLLPFKAQASAWMASNRSGASGGVLDSGVAGVA